MELAKNVIYPKRPEDSRRRPQVTSMFRPSNPGANRTEQEKNAAEQEKFIRETNAAILLATDNWETLPEIDIRDIFEPKNPRLRLTEPFSDNLKSTREAVKEALENAA